MRALADIGPKVTHTFQVTNDGPWHVDEMEVIIQWPFQLAPPLGRKTGQGKWLLYLTDAPEITPPGAGQCFLNPRTINSLGLRERGVGGGRLGGGGSSSASESSVKRRRRRRRRSARVIDSGDGADSPFRYNTLQSDSKRDSFSDFNSNDVLSTFSVDAPSGYVVDCANDAVQCHTFRCRRYETFYGVVIR
jgi:Integrin alpha